MACHTSAYTEYKNALPIRRKTKILIQAPIALQWMPIKYALEKNFGKVKYIKRAKCHENAFICEFYYIQDITDAIRARQLHVNQCLASITQCCDNDDDELTEISEPLQGRQLLVSNLPYSVSWQQLKDCFKEYGYVERTSIPLNMVWQLIRWVRAWALAMFYSRMQKVLQLLKV